MQKPESRCGSPVLQLMPKYAREAASGRFSVCLYSLYICSGFAARHDITLSAVAVKAGVDFLDSWNCIPAWKGRTVCKCGKSLLL